MVTRTAGALDPNTRTLLTEVQVANHTGELRPGMFMDVNLMNPRSNPPLLIPGDALIVDEHGAHVGVLEDVGQAPPEPQQDKEQQQQGKRQNDKKRQQEAIEGTIRMRQVSGGTRLRRGHRDFERAGVRRAGGSESKR